MGAPNWDMKGEFRSPIQPLHLRRALTRIKRSQYVLRSSLSSSFDDPVSLDDVEFAKLEADGGALIEPGAYVSEAALWLSWMRGGFMHARSDSEVLKVDRKSFRGHARNHPSAFHLCSTYAHFFYRRCESRTAAGDRCTDLFKAYDSTVSLMQDTDAALFGPPPLVPSLGPTRSLRLTFKSIARLSMTSEAIDSDHHSIGDPGAGQTTNRNIHREEAIFAL